MDPHSNTHLGDTPLLKDAMLEKETPTLAMSRKKQERPLAQVECRWRRSWLKLYACRVKGDWGRMLMQFLGRLQAESFRWSRRMRLWQPARRWVEQARASSS